VEVIENVIGTGLGDHKLQYMAGAGVCFCTSRSNEFSTPVM